MIPKIKIIISILFCFRLFRSYFLHIALSLDNAMLKRSPLNTVEIKGVFLTVTGVCTVKVKLPFHRSSVTESVVDCLRFSVE